MGIFHEIYGTYFRIVTRLLGKKHLTGSEISDCITREGFRDSVLFLPGRILPQKDQSDWRLLRAEEDGTFSPVTKHEPPRPLTLLQKRWLRTRLDDPRMGLFLSEAERGALRAQLAGAEPLYEPEMLLYDDQFRDGDPFGDERYQQHFREILTAVRTREILDVFYRSGRDESRHMLVVPLRIEYSEKNDKLRVYCIDLWKRRKGRVILLNLGRILSLHRKKERYTEEICTEQLFDRLRCREPVTVRVTPERNAVERFLMEFASCRKRTERDASTGVITVQLWYDQMDETELLIRLLGFGPVLEILSPPGFRKMAAERLRKQCELLL